MKKLWQKFIEWLKGELDKKKVKVDPEVKKEDKPVTDTGGASADSCGCDLSKPLSTPPYTAEELDRMGNASECPTITGRDVRLICKREGSKTWLLGQLLPKAVTFNGSQMTCKCFDKNEYHFLGYAYNTSEESKMIPAKAGESFQYKTTTFIWYEYRK